MPDTYFVRIRPYLPSLARPPSFSGAPKSCAQNRTAASPPAAIRQCVPVAGPLALHPVCPWETRLAIYPHIDRLETACFGLGLFDNASRGNCSRQRPFLQYFLRSRGVSQTGRKEGFPVRIPGDKSQTPEIAPRDGGIPSELQSSSCVGFDSLEPDGATGIQLSATASQECGPVTQVKFPFVFRRVGSLAGMWRSPFRWTNKQAIERRGNFGPGRLGVTFRRLTWIWNHVENTTGTLDKAIFVMA